MKNRNFEFRLDFPLKSEIGQAFHVILTALGVCFIIIILLGISGIIDGWDDSPSQQESIHAVTVENYHMGPNKWVNIWTIDGHWLIQHADGFLHHPGCPLELAETP